MAAQNGSSSKKSLKDLSVPYRVILTQSKPYPATTIGAIPALAESLKWGFADGETGLYLGVYPYRLTNLLSYPSEGSDLSIPGNEPTVSEIYIWPIYDIDGDNKEIASAIHKAKRIHAFLTAQGLAPYTNWILTGNGLRCVFIFLIPYSLREGWIEHLKSVGIDSNPYASTAGGGAPMRLLCYRGNLKQCGDEAKKIDRHCELIEPKLLAGLDEKKYLELTAGRPDPETYVRWAKEILPVKIFDTSGTLPPEIARFFDLLKEHQYKLQLRQNIRSGSPFRTERSLDIYKVLQYLDSQGIKYRERSSLRIWKLDECPRCGRKDHAFVHENGYLHCFADSCDAARHAGGLSPAKWVEENLFVKSGKSAPQDEPKTVRCEKAERMVAEHLNHDGNIAVAVTPGVGKTTIGFERALAFARDQLVVYAMPQHELIDEWVQRIGASSTGTRVFHFKGRDDTNCRKKNEVQSASLSGYYPAQTVCVKCDGNPRNPSSNICDYNRQFLIIATIKKGLVLCATAHLPYLLMDSRISNAGVGTVFIDEQALTAMVHREKVRTGFETSLHLFNKDARSVLEKIMKASDDLMHELATMPDKPIGKLYTTDPGGTWWRSKPNLWDIIGITKKDARSILGPEVDRLLDEGHYDLRREFVNRHELLLLKTALDDQGTAWIQVEKKPRGNPETFFYIEKLPIPENTRIIVLDATVSTEELEAIFGLRFDTLQLNVEWEGKRIHIKRGMGMAKKAAMTKEKFLNHAKKTIAPHIPPDAKKGLLCTHKSDEKRTLEWMEEAFPQVEWQASHYFADRGKNSYEDSDVVYAYGIPIFNPDFMQEQAAFLFPGARPRQLQWIEEQNAAELYQKVHRARFVRHPGKTLIVEGHYWPPILGEPDQVIDLTRSGNPFIEASERTREIYKTLGFIDKLIAATLNIGVKGDEIKVEKIRENLEELFRKLGNSDLGVYQPLYKFNKSRYTLSSSPIFTPNKNKWSTLLSLLQHEMGGGIFEIKLPDWGNTWTKAVGDMKAAEKFYAELSRAVIAAGVALAVPGSADIRGIEKSSEIMAEKTIQDDSDHLDLVG